MAEELRWVLILISAFVIGGLLIHGLWSVRKRNEAQPLEAAPVVQREMEAVSDSLVVAEEKEPELGDMSFSADQDNDIRVEGEDSPAEEEAEAAEISDFIILHIHMPEGLTMQGSKLLPLLLTLGFKYSEDGFFNRHLDPSGNGAVLFRLVNMYNPGTFDIDNMEQFSTAGISLFMTLPCEGDSLAAFNMLHSAAKKISEEFGAEILDSERQPLSVNRVREYVEKVREFSA